MKSEYPKQTWWSKVNCPKCGKLMSVQHWGGNDYRITCLCGHVYHSKSPSGEDDLHGQIGPNL